MTAENQPARKKPGPKPGSKKQKSQAVAIRSATAAPVKAPAFVDHGDPIVNMIAHAARDPSVDVSKMRELFALQGEHKKEQARVAYLRDMTDLQNALPSIRKDGMIVIKKKDARPGDQPEQATAFATWPNIMRTILPILHQHGFNLTFRTDSSPEGLQIVTAVLGHKEGHEERSTMVLPIDASGSKNNVQGRGSSLTYGKRYTGSAILNLITEDEPEQDTNGVAQADLELISAEQAQTIRNALAFTGASEEKLLAHLKIDAIESILARKYEFVMGVIRNRAARAAEQEKGGVQ